jgi:hypothetical protein
MSKLAKTARNAMIADAALAFARDRIAAQLPGVEPRKRHRGRKALLIGGAVAAGALLLAKRGKVAALLPGRSDEPAPPPPPPARETPPISNYDAPGPVENTATRVPTPPPYESPAIDEAAEEAAAAAEAANIGGPVSDYAGSEFGESATEAERPLMEAGEGESEGQEQTEAELAEAAESAEGMSDAEHQIDEAIEAQSNPLGGETPEPVRPEEPLPPEGQQASEWRTWSGRSVNP